MHRISEISFPGFGIEPFKVDSVAFSIGELTIAWYALIITFGIICAVAYGVFRAKRINLTFDDVIDYAIFAVPSGVIGGRLYYVLTSLEKYHSFKEVINIRKGGIAIYGAILLGALAVFIVSKVKKIPFLAFGDCVMPGIILAQSIGRWGNFMNGEAFGAQTDIFCRMGLRNSLTGYEIQYVHPTFLYESLWNLIGFILINVFYKHKKYDGQIVIMLFGWYGLGRMFIEGLRQDSLYSTVFGLTFRTSQALAGMFFICSVVILFYLHFKKYEKPLYKK